MPSPDALRQRRYRQRKKATAAAAPILFERGDWQLFCEPHSLQQKAGCEPGQIGRAVLKELVDNALDSSPASALDLVTVTGDERHCIVSDGGAGVPPDELARLFSINRSLVTSKLVRLPTRGMLGNGLRVVMGAVVAYNGTIWVTTRGRRYQLIPSRENGLTQVRPGAETEASTTVVELRFSNPLFTDADYHFCREAVRLAAYGGVYPGPSLPSWYSAQDLLDMLQARPRGMSPHTVVRRLFEVAVEPFAPSLAWVEALKRDHPAVIEAGAIGGLGAAAFDDGSSYREVAGTAAIAGAVVPFHVEVWVDAEAAEKGVRSSTAPARSPRSEPMPTAPVCA